MTQTSRLHLPWKVKLVTTVLGFAVDITRRTDCTVNRFLMSLFDLKSSPSKKPINGVTTTDITVDKARNLWFRLYTPPSPSGDNDSTMPVIFYFHGGGFAYLSADSKPLDNLCYQLSGRLSAVVISVNYRLAPEHRHPAQLEDCFDVLKFIDENQVESFPSYANLKRCFLLGDSAGGTLVHQILIKAGHNEFNRIKFAGSILIQPFFGGEERTESEIELDGKDPVINLARTDWMWKAFLPEGSNRDHPVSNVFGRNSDDISELNFPESIIFVSGFDPLKDRQKGYYEELIKIGKKADLKVYPETFHGFHIFPELPVFSELINDMKDFMQKQLLESK